MESGVLSSNYPCRKDAPEDKDPPEGNGTCLSKVIPSSSWSIASCNADVSSVMKQAKRSFTKTCYTNSYEANSSTEIWNLQVVNLCKHIIIPQLFSTNKNLNQFVKVLLVKLSDMLHLSNFVRLFHRQSFTLYGITIMLHLSIIMMASVKEIRNCM